MMRSGVVLLVLLAVALAGCGGKHDSSSSDASSSSASSSGTPTSGAPSASSTPTGPLCDDVWKVGKDLPADYTSCYRPGGKPEQETYACQDGRSLIAFDNEWYAITGGTIHKPAAAPMQDTIAYGKAYDACVGS